MSAILLNNPFAAPPPAPNVPTSNPAAVVSAIPAANGADAAKDDLPSRGADTGDRMSKQAEAVALLQMYQTTKRPSDATSDSVINAQTTNQADTGEVELGPDLPEVEMPDPLPTSPILLRMRENA